MVFRFLGPTLAMKKLSTFFSYTPTYINPYENVFLKCIIWDLQILFFNSWSRNTDAKWLSEILWECVCPVPWSPVKALVLQSLCSNQGHSTDPELFSCIIDAVIVMRVWPWLLWYHLDSFFSYGNSHFVTSFIFLALLPDLFLLIISTINYITTEICHWESVYMSS